MNHNLLEKICYLSLTAAACVAIAVLLRRELGPNAPRGVVRSPIAEEQLLVGKPLKLRGLKLSHRNLVIAISTNCAYCRESLPFYRRASQLRSRGPRPFEIVVVSSGSTVELGDYLKVNSVVADAILSIPLRDLSVSGTPTLLATNEKGVVVGAFIGLLPATREEAVLNTLQSIP